MYWQPGATARAVADAGLRATIGAPLIDGGDAAGLDRAAGGRGRRARGARRGSPATITASLAPHAIYTVSPESLRWIGERSERARPADPDPRLRDRGRGRRPASAAHGCRPVELPRPLGLLGPRTLLAHAVWLDDAERELIAARGATVVTNPVANMKLAVGAHLRPAGGAAARDPGRARDRRRRLEQLARPARRRQAPGAGPEAPRRRRRRGRLPRRSWRSPPGARRPLLGADAARGRRAGRLPARPPRRSRRSALGVLAAGLVYAALAVVVDTTVVAGRVLMRGGVVEGEAEIVARARERAARLGLR